MLSKKMTVFKKRGKPPGHSRKISEVMQQVARKKRFKQIGITLILAVIILFFFTGSRGTWQLIKFFEKKDDLENEIRELEKEKNARAEILKKVENDSGYIEKIAREKYKMKKEGERVYQVVEEK